MGVLQQLINGVALGAVYALFAMGFGIVFSTMGILNLAQGVYATWGAIASYEVAQHWGLSFWPSLAAGAIAGAVVAAFVDQVAFQPLRSRERTLLGTLITSVAAWLALKEVARIATGSAPLQLPPGAEPISAIHIGKLEIISYQLDAIIVALVLTVLVYALLHRTRAGAAIRAVGFDTVAASLGGVNSRRILIGAACLAGALSAMAGVFAGLSTNVSYSLGDTLLMSGFAAVVIGGVGDVRGAALGGFLIGIIQILSAQYISNNFQDAITFGLLLVFLIARPRGFLGVKDAVRA